MQPEDLLPCGNTGGLSAVLQAVEHPLSSLVFMECENAAFWDHWQGKESCPLLGTHKPCNLYTSCSRHPKNKLQPFSIFSSEERFEAAAFTNSSNFIPQLYQCSHEQSGSKEETCQQECAVLHIFYTTWSRLNLSGPFPCSSNSNLSLAFLISPPMPCSAVTCREWRRPEQQVPRLHVPSLMLASGSVCCMNCQGKRGIHSHLWLLPASPSCGPETHPMMSMRKAD